MPTVNTLDLKMDIVENVAAAYTFEKTNSFCPAGV